MLDIRAFLQTINAIVSTLLALPAWIFDAIFAPPRMLTIGACVCVVAGTGCASIQDMVRPAVPHTKASYGAFSGFNLDDTKNNDIDAEGEYNAKTGDYKVKFKIRNNASDVMLANVEQMKVFTLGLAARVEQMDARTREVEAHGRNIIGSLEQIKGMLGEVISPLKGASIDIDGPLGKGGVKTGGGAPIAPLQPLDDSPNP